MSRKARIWTGVTLLAIILFNYLVIGVPLYKRMNSLDNKVKVFTKHSEDTYVIDVLKREMITIDKKLVVLNCVAASAAIIIMSWIIFGLVINRPGQPACRQAGRRL